MHSLQLTALVIRVPPPDLYLPVPVPMPMPVQAPLVLIRHAVQAAATQTWQTKSMRQPLETTRWLRLQGESEHGRCCCRCCVGLVAATKAGCCHLAAWQLWGELCMATAFIGGLTLVSASGFWLRTTWRMSNEHVYAVSKRSARTYTEIVPCLCVCVCVWVCSPRYCHSNLDYLCSCPASLTSCASCSRNRLTASLPSVPSPFFTYFSGADFWF